jgi:hypothetical protein
MIYYLAGRLSGILSNIDSFPNRVQRVDASGTLKAKSETTHRRLSASASMEQSESDLNAKIGLFFNDFGERQGHSALKYLHSASVRNSTF